MNSLNSSLRGRIPLKLSLVGAAVGLEHIGVKFNPNRPHAGCNICGDVYQTNDDRKLTQFSPPVEHLRSKERREEWRRKHHRMHNEHEHLLLEMSGNATTPEAAHRLAAFGAISLTDLVLSTEHSAALAESSPVPKDDAYGSQ